MTKTKKLAIFIILLAVVLLFRPSIGNATTIVDNDLVKSADSPALYLIQENYKRVFPHAAVYRSWGHPEDFSTVKVVGIAELDAYPDGNPVPFRDGSLFRGTATSLYGKSASAVFYVEYAKLRAVKSELIYQMLFNDPNWEKVVWVPDDLLDKFEYKMGESIGNPEIYPDNLFVTFGGKYGLSSDGGKKIKYFLNDAAISNNRYKKENAVNLTKQIFKEMTEEASISSPKAELITPGWKTISLEKVQTLISNVEQQIEDISQTRDDLEELTILTSANFTVDYERRAKEQLLEEIDRITPTLSERKENLESVLERLKAEAKLKNRSLDDIPILSSGQLIDPETKFIKSALSIILTDRIPSLWEKAFEEKIEQLLDDSQNKVKILTSFTQFQKSRFYKKYQTQMMSALESGVSRYKNVMASKEQEIEWFPYKPSLVDEYNSLIDQYNLFILIWNRGLTTG